MSKSIKKNYFYNVAYQILILILPLITAPYISRVIGAEGLGIYSYTYSIAYYFALIGMLGVNNYGNRLIAKCRKNKSELSKRFWEIYSLQLITTVLALIIYIIYMLSITNEYKEYAIIQIIYIISECIDINWFFFGLEKFKLTVMRNTIIKLASVLCIFVFVKTKDDLVKYTFIMTITSLLSQLSLWIFVKKEIEFIKPKISEIKKHIKPNIILFIPVIAVSLYKVMDKIMLGNMTNVQNVGLYENAEKIIGIPLSLITALGTVMLPRMSNLLANNNSEKLYEYIRKSLVFSMFLAVPTIYGLIGIGTDFAPLFFGEEFIQTGIIIQYLAITIIFISIANVIRTQYLIPKEKDKIYVISTIAGAIVNLIMNYLLIPKYQTIGASIGTIFAEFAVFIIQILYVWKELKIKQYIPNLLSFLFKGFVMFIVVCLLNNISANVEIKIVIQIVSAIITYILLNINYISSIFNIKSILKRRKI